MTVHRRFTWRNLAQIFTARLHLPRLHLPRRLPRKITRSAI